MHPMAKGMVTYALLWPTGSLIQQTIDGRNFSKSTRDCFKITPISIIQYPIPISLPFPETYDWARALRFSIFGSLYVAPCLYGWVRLTSAMWPQTNLRIGLLKVSKSAAGSTWLTDWQTP